jgi:hypothetical protein
MMMRAPKGASAARRAGAEGAPQEGAGAGVGGSGAPHARPHRPGRLLQDRAGGGAPKTRSGKILRQTVRKIADREEYKVPATIDDPAILGEIAEGLWAVGVG